MLINSDVRGGKKSPNSAAAEDTIDTTMFITTPTMSLNSCRMCPVLAHSPLVDSWKKTYQNE